MITTIYRASDFIRSLYVYYNSKGYEIHSIIFFKDGKELLTWDRGFFDKDYDKIKISDKDIIRKLKPDLNLKQPFITTYKESWQQKPRANLYIYVDDTNIKLSKPTESIEKHELDIWVYDNYTLTMFDTVIDIKKCINCIDTPLGEKSKQLAKEFKDKFYIDVSSYDISKILKDYDIVKRKP